MAELVILPESTHPRYEEGDILCAFSDARIGEVHASHICHPSTVGFNSDGLRERDTLLERFNILGYRYRFTRVTQTFLVRDDLRDPFAEVEVFGLRPNAKGESIDIEAYLKARMPNPNHQVFGVSGAEVWYGGQWILDVPKIWAEIESRTSFRRADFQKWPLTDYERRRFLGVTVADIDEAWLDPLRVDETAEGVVKLRAHGVDWKNRILPHLGGRYSLQDILDHTKEVEIRDLPFDARRLVRPKRAH